MGLDMSHDAWHGAYSAFTRFRTTLAEVAGLPLVDDPDMPGVKSVDVDWNAVSSANIEGEWGEKLPTLRDGTFDPLLLLLVHSDGDGVLHPYHAKLIADRVEELIPLLPLDGGGHIGVYADKARKLVDGFRAAHAANEPIEFY
jgi:hypothetical protein